MIRFLLYCLPLARRIRPRIRRNVARGVGASTVAKVAAVAVVAGPVCFMLPVWGGGSISPVAVVAPVAAPAAPLPSTSTFGSYGGSIYGTTDLRDIIGLVPAPGMSILPPGEMLVVAQVATEQGRPVTVPEPASVSLFAAALVLMGVVRRRV